MEDWSQSGELPKWVEIQTKTFTRWANTFLKERMQKIESLQNDLSDGLLLISLLETISSKSIGKYNKAPKIRAQKLENTQFALAFLEKEGIKLVNIGNQDIVDCNLKLILGLIWTIILRYQINIEEGKSARSDLLKWVREQIPEYDIKNFTKDWNDGRAICALANSLKPGLIPNHRELDPSRSYENAYLGTDIAEKDLGIPKVLAPEDMINPEVDELSMMTYISYYRDWLGAEGRRRRQEEIERTAVPGKCRAYGPGLEKGETGVPTEFYIEAINANGRRVPQGGDPFKVNLRSPKGPVPFEQIDQNNGLYTVKYTPRDPGTHLVEITLHDKQISGSPYRVPVVRSGPDAGQSRAYGPGLEGGQVGAPALFTIEARNKSGEPLKEGGDPFDVKVNGPYPTPVPIEMKDNKDGTYSVSYHPQDPGRHVVQVTLAGVPIQNSPWTVNIDQDPGSADAMQCIAYGPGLEGGSTSDQGTFTVEVRNGAGERIMRPGVPIDCEISDPNGTEIPAKVQDNQDGTFTVSYQPQDPGSHTIDVILRHPRLPLYYHHIKDSPFHVSIAAGTDASKSIAFGPGLENGIPDTLPTAFTIQAKDKFGNDIKKGGDLFEAKVLGPKGPVDAQLTDNGDGTYRVDYEPKEPGKHKIDVTLKGKPIMDAPFSVMVREGADSDHTFIEGFTFTIQARTKRNQNKKEGGDTFKVQIDGPNGPVPDIKIADHNNGLYTVSYKLPGPGEYNVNVLVNDKHIKGSPWKQHL